MTALLFALMGLLFAFAPLLARLFGHPLGMIEGALLTGFGTAVLLVTGALMAVMRLYQKTKASEAFVRTGHGGALVIRDGGSFVIPFVHELVRVPLVTLRLEVTRENVDALITEDKLRADVRAEFFVRVQPDIESILQASRSLGDSLANHAEVRELVEDKLVSALRTAAASKTLEQLNSERDEFLIEVTRLVAEDLKSNGLVLETVTISKLDQTDDSFLKAENIFDAQGKRKIAEITQRNLTERNRLVREGEHERKQQDVFANKAALALELSEAEAVSRQQAEVQKIQVEAKRELHVRSIEANKQIELAAIEKQRELELAARMQQQAVEIAEREKQERIAEAEQKRSIAERALADAEAERERSRQQIETVRVTVEAERDKAQKVLAAEAAAEMQFVTGQRQADADAYAKQKQAEAQRLAADAEAEAIRKRAQADAEAETARALGARARAMVPVEVQRAELDLERERVEGVIARELEAREKHGRVAQDFELAKLRIEADKQVRIAVAGAQASLFSKMEANLYGTTEDVHKLLDALVRGQVTANTLNGFFEQGDEQTRAAIAQVGKSLGELASSAADRLRGDEAHAEE